MCAVTKEFRNHSNVAEIIEIKGKAGLSHQCIQSSWLPTGISIWVLKGFCEVTQARASLHCSSCLAAFAQETWSVWGHKVENRGQEPGKRLKCAIEMWQRGKKSSTISKGMGFRSKTNHVSSFVVKEKRIHSVLGQKKELSPNFLNSIVS